MKHTARELSLEEVRDNFLKAVWRSIRYWQRLDGPASDRIEGAVFSVLAMLDGSAADLPGFVVAPAPHPDDKQYSIDRGENYFPEAPGAGCDIAGPLHTLFYSVERNIAETPRRRRTDSR